MLAAAHHKLSSNKLEEFKLHLNHGGFGDYKEYDI